MMKSQQSARAGRRKFRSKFTLEEDELLKKLVEIHGIASWDLISSQMRTRSARQCHDRWTSYLSPSIRWDPWTDEEDQRLIRLINENGPKWVLLSKSFNNRTDSSLKNRWNILKRRMRQPTSFPPFHFLYPQIYSNQAFQYHPPYAHISTHQNITIEGAQQSSMMISKGLKHSGVQQTVQYAQTEDIVSAEAASIVENPLKNLFRDEEYLFIHFD